MFKGGARGIVVNNYIANPGHTAIRYVLVDHEWGVLPRQIGQMAIVGNVLHYGADTRPGLPLLTVDGGGPCEVFLDDNVALDTHGARSRRCWASSPTSFRWCGARCGRPGSCPCTPPTSRRT